MCNLINVSGGPEFFYNIRTNITKVSQPPCFIVKSMYSDIYRKYNLTLNLTN